MNRVLTKWPGSVSFSFQTETLLHHRKRQLANDEYRRQDVSMTSKLLPKLKCETETNFQQCNKDMKLRSELSDVEMSKKAN